MIKTQKVTSETIEKMKKHPNTTPTMVGTLSLYFEFASSVMEAVGCIIGTTYGSSTDSGGCGKTGSSGLGLTGSYGTGTRGSSGLTGSSGIGTGSTGLTGSSGTGTGSTGLTGSSGTCSTGLIGSSGTGTGSKGLTGS